MKIARFFIKSFLAIFLLTLIFWTIVLGTLQTKQGQAWALNQIKTFVEGQTQTQIEIGKVSFSFPLEIGLEDVSLSQKNQQIITLNKVEVCCSYTSLLQGRLIFSKLFASDINILHLPDSEENRIESSKKAWDAPPLPFYLKFANINLHHIHIGQEILQTMKLEKEMTDLLMSSLFDLQGMVSNNPFRNSLTAHLFLKVKQQETDLQLITIGIDAQNHQLSLSFHSNQLPFQFLYPKLPPTLKGNIALFLSAPVASWQSLKETSTLADEITGHFKISLEPTQESHDFLFLSTGHTLLKGQCCLNPNKELQLTDLKMEHPNLFMKGALTLTEKGEIRQGNFKGNMESGNLLQGFDCKGKVSFECQVKGFFKSPSVLVNLESSSLTLLGNSFDNIQSVIEINPENEKLKGDLYLSFKHLESPWYISTAFNWQDGKQGALSQLFIEGLQTTLEGDLVCHLPDYLFDGELNASSDDFEAISQFISIPFNGRGQLNIQLSKLSDQQGLKMEGSAQDIICKDFKANALSVNLQTDFHKKNKDFIQIQSTLIGEQLGWQEIAMEQCEIRSTHKIDIANRTLQEIVAEWRGKEIRWNGGKSSLAEGNASLQDPLNEPQGMIQVALQDCQISGLQLKRLAGTTTFHKFHKGSPFQISGEGFFKKPFILAANGEWSHENEQFEIRTTALNGKYGDYPLHLNHPFYFMKHPHAMQLSEISLAFGEAIFEGEFHQSNETLFSQFKTNALPTHIFSLLFPDLPLSGKVTFQGRLEGSIQQPTGHFEVDLHNVQIVEEVFAQKPFVNGRVFIELDPKGLHLATTLKGIGPNPVMVQGTLPITLSLDPWKVKTASNIPFNLNVNAEGKLDPYLHLFYNDTINLSGDAKMALKITGQMDKPLILGEINLLNGTFESLSTGALYQHIQAKLQGDGSKVILSHFSAQDSKQGTITANGSLAIDPSKNFPFELNVNSSHVSILEADYAELSASGPLSLKGDLKHSKLQGKLTIDKAILRLEETLPHQVKTVDVKYINQSPEEQLLLQPEKKENHSTVELDLLVQVPQNFQIEGKNLKSEWKGSIEVKGTPDQPQLHGELRVAKGEYDFNGKVFNLSQGTIHFAGAPDKKTTLYIVASKDIDRIKADIIVKGPVKKPVISFRSNPPLSQRDVLSYILFNRGISDITSNQGDQLSQSFIELNASEQQSKKSEDFLSRLRNNIGIDRLDFTTMNKENKDFGLQVGKNLTENISVTVNQSMTTLDPAIAVEVKLPKNFKAQAETGFGEDAPVRTLLKWKKDY